MGSSVAIKTKMSYMMWVTVNHDTARWAVAIKGVVRWE